MQRILVTGGAGFIGSALVRQLIREGTSQVLTIDKLTYAGSLLSLKDPMISERHRFERLDICDGDGLRAVVESFKPTSIIHLAAESHVDRSIDGPAEFVHTNIVGTFTVLQESLRYWRALPPTERDAFRLLHVSTDEVFGSLGDEGFFTELTPYDPSSPYSATKAGADHLVRAWNRTYGLPTLTTNCSNNFGPYQFPEKLIPLVIRRALSGRSLPVYGAGQNVRDWLFVDDHVDALLTVLSRGRVGETYNISARAERKNIDVVRSICAILDSLAPRSEGPYDTMIEFVTDRPGHDLRYAIDPQKLEKETGWRPKMSFDTALEQTVKWYMANQQWCDAVQTGQADAARLGLSKKT